jgi:hypothetical protein
MNLTICFISRALSSHLVYDNMGRNMDSITTSNDARKLIERIAQNYDSKHVDELAGLPEEQADRNQGHRLNIIAIIEV